MLIGKTLFFLLVLIVGTILLQIFLSKRKSKWFGLILPVICLLISLTAVLGSTMYTGELTLQQVAADGTVIDEQVMEQTDHPLFDPGTVFLQMAVSFLLFNLPTAVLLLIYFACREQLKKSRQLEKMSIQDLE